MVPIPEEVVAVVLAASAVAALTDVWRFKVYNVLTLPLLFGGLAYHAYTGGWSGLGLSAAGATFGLAVFMLPYVMGGMGITPLAVIVFFGCMATGMYALVLVCRAGGIRQLWLQTQLTMFRFASVGRLLVADDKMEHIHDWTQSPERRRRLIPFSAMMAVGVVITLILGYAASQSGIAGSN
jgi:prepilin peptidase CpaA